MKTCMTCKWCHDPEFTSVCVNSDSEKCADFAFDDYWCELWEEDE